jgi:hypothetical protein
VSAKDAEAAAIRDRLHELLSGLGTRERRKLARILLEAAVVAALEGEQGLPAKLRGAARSWSEKRADITRDCAQLVWGKVCELAGHVGPRKRVKVTHGRRMETVIEPVSKLPRNTFSVRNVFAAAAVELDMKEGTVRRVYYAELSRRKAAGAWTPEWSADDQWHEGTETFSIQKQRVRIFRRT